MRCGCCTSNIHIRDRSAAVTLFNFLVPVPWQKKYERDGASTADRPESSRMMPIMSIVFPVPAGPLVHSSRHDRESDSPQLVKAAKLSVARIQSQASRRNL